MNHSESFTPFSPKTKYKVFFQIYRDTLNLLVHRMVIYQCRFIDYNNCAIMMPNIDSRGRYAMSGQRIYENCTFHSFMPWT